MVLACVLTGCAAAPDPETSPPPSSDPDWTALAAQRLPLLERCEIPNAPETLLCGTIEVWEDRAAASGRRIGLNVVVVPAHNEKPPDDPIFVFEGGPGGAVTQRAVGMTYAGPVRTRDIVLVDQRGTGGSHPLHCDLGGGQPSLGELDEMFPPDDVRHCAERLSGDAEVRLYGSEHFADDVEEVRRRLGYGPINVRGGSYGTRAMMVFAQRHPESTRTLFGIGVDSPTRSNLAERGVWSDRILAQLAGLCAGDAECAAVAPELDTAVAGILARLEEHGPRRVELADPNDPESRLTLEVGRAWLSEQLRLILYYAFTSRALPWAVHRAAAAGDWEPLVQLAVLIQRMFQSSLAYGVLLTVQCSENMDFDVDAALERGAATLFGNYRLEQQIQGCAHWPHEVRPPLGVDEPRVLDVPALFLSGALDPVTPPAYADDATRYFPGSLHVVLDEGQHGPFDLEGAWDCVHRIWADLLDRGSVEGLDVSCAEEMRRPPFIVDAEAFDRYVEEVLAPMVE